MLDEDASDPKTRPVFEYRPRRVAFRQTDEIERLASALVRAQANIKAAERNVVNPHYQHKYADLSSVMAAVMPSLTAAGICVIQGPTTSEEDGEIVVTMTTRLMHESGQWIENDLSARPRGYDPQAVGSTITYLKRYGLSAMVGCAAEEDDDAERSYGRDRGNDGNDGNRSRDAKGKGDKKQEPKRLAKKDLDAIAVAFKKFGVTIEKLEEKLEKKSSDWTESDRAKTVKLYKEIENGAAVEDVFGVDIQEPKAAEEPAGKDEPGADG